jgi:MFS family permease
LASIAAACGTALTARRLGLRRTMVWAAIAVGVGCAISALTPNMLGMLIGRAIQGLGGGALVAATVIGVGSLFPASFTPRVMAAISAVWGSSAFLGPLVGGIFAEMGIWRVGFWVFVGQAVILAVALQFALPAGEKIDKGARRFPYRRLAVLSAAILSIASAGLAHGNTVLVAALCIAGVLGLALFVRLDRNAGEDRLLPRAIANPARGAGPGFIGIFAIAMTTIPFTVYGPILMDRVHGVGPLAVGYMIALESVAWTIGALGFAGLTGAAQTRLIRAAFAAILVSAARPRGLRGLGAGLGRASLPVSRRPGLRRVLRPHRPTLRRRRSGRGSRPRRRGHADHSSDRLCPRILDLRADGESRRIRGRRDAGRGGSGRVLDFRDHAARGDRGAVHHSQARIG